MRMPLITRDKFWLIVDRRGFIKHLFTVAQFLLNSNEIMDTGKELMLKILISQEERQGCSMLPTLFNVDMGDLIRDWKNLRNCSGIEIVITILFPDNQDPRISYSCQSISFIN